MKLKNKIFSLYLLALFTSSCIASDKQSFAAFRDDYLKELPKSIAFIKEVLDLKEEKIQMPNEATLLERLNKENFLKTFVEYTSIIKHLADKELFATDVFIATEHAMFEHEKNYEKFSCGPSVRRYQTELIQAILKDHPSALEQLEQLKIIK